MTESPTFKDDDYNWKWGAAGNTAKLMAVKWCSDNGFYNTKINDRGNWNFSATCSNTVPAGWSRRFSDESAREINPNWNRDDAARADCVSKGYYDIDRNQWNVGGFFDYSVRCKSRPDVSWVGPISGTDPVGRRITAYRCDNWLNNDPNSCINSPTKPANLSRWEACPQGSPLGSGLCGPFSNGPNDINCVRGQDCYAITDVVEPPKPDVTWSSPINATDPVGRQITGQRCDNWPIVNGVANVNACLESPTKPSETIGWETCPSGSPLGSGLCGPISSSPTDFNCRWGQDCYAITRVVEPPNPTRWSQTLQACDGDDKIKYQMCEGWGTNPGLCLTSPNRPMTIVDWKKCGELSSPGGLVPGKPFNACPVPASASFNCVAGQECIAVLERTPNDQGCVTTNPANILNPLNPLNPIGGFFSSLGSWSRIIGGISLGLCLLCLCILLLYVLSGFVNTPATGTARVTGLSVPAAGTTASALSSTLPRSLPTATLPVARPVVTIPSTLPRSPLTGVSRPIIPSSPIAPSLPSSLRRL
jgi:hypothetical protein